MRIQYASDLHLEFAENSSYLKHNPLNVVGDILVLAGDIGYIGDDNYSKHPFWNWASENYKEVIVIPGNHEFYKMFDLDKLYNGWMFEIRKNVKCCYNAVIPLREDVELVATTLWSHISFQDAFRTESAISDFRRIRVGSDPLDFNRFNEEHYRCFNFLKNAVANSKAGHIIVATHHVPTFELIAPEYKGSPLNGAFVVELGGYIAGSPIEYWIYGHSHRNIDRTIGKTKCISNQLGYVFHNEHAWKIQARMPPCAERVLTPENDFSLTTIESCPSGSILFQFICRLGLLDIWAIVRATFGREESHLPELPAAPEV